MIAPASGFERGAFEAGLALLKARYRAGYGDGLFERERYLAGSDARRLAELRAALADPDIRAVFCARGGYGATRLLARLAGQAPEGPPKLRIKTKSTATLPSIHWGRLRYCGRCERRVKKPHAAKAFCDGCTVVARRFRA